MKEKEKDQVVFVGDHSALSQAWLPDKTGHNQPPALLRVNMSMQPYTYYPPYYTPSLFVLFFGGETEMVPLS